MPAYKSAEFIEDSDDELEIIDPRGDVLEENPPADVEIGAPDATKATVLNKRRRTMPDGEGKFVPFTIFTYKTL
jgi:hypothetical protein